MDEVREQFERPEKGGWSLVAQDSAAENWSGLSLNGLYFRHPVLLERSVLPREFSVEAPETVDAWKLFRRYGKELWVIEHDLTQCINSMKTDYESLYGHESLHREFLHLKRFSIVYHIDNFYVRVHKLISNLHTLLGLMAGLQPRKGQSRAEFKKQREDLGRALRRCGLTTVAEVLDRFEHDPLIVRAREARNLFVHEYGEDLTPRWEAVLGVEARLGEDRGEEDEVARGLRRVIQDEDLTRFGDERADELHQTLRAIRTCRNRLYVASQNALIKLAAQWSSDAQQFTHFISGRLQEEWLRASPDDREFDRLDRKLNSITERFKKGTTPDGGTAPC